MAGERTKRQQRADRNRRRLLGAAMKVFSQKGYHRATLDEICRRANLAKGTVYQHFSNKKGLFLDLVDSLLTDLGQSIAEAVHRVEEDVDRVRAAVSAYVGFSEAHRSFYQLLIHEESSFSGEIKERFHSKYFSHLRILEEVLRRGMKSGTMKKMDPTGAASALMGICNASIFRWLISEKPYPLKKEIRLILEIFLRGISLPSNTKGT